MGPAAAMTGIVEQATKVLASEQPRIKPEPYVLPAAGSSISSQGISAGQLQEQVKVLIDQFVALASRAQPLGTALPQAMLVRGRESSADPAGLTIEPAPVLSPSGPVAPGSTAQVSIKLVNEDDQPAYVGFLSTALVGEDGAQIPAVNVSFHPREMTLEPGRNGAVIVSVTIPAQARGGFYSGLLRASRLEYLHAVLVVQVESDMGKA
jgi:hypothetical protein